MTKYNFDQVVDREHSCSAKYDERVKHFGTDQVIPMWIADMDFPTAPAVIDAMVRRAQEGICGYAARPASYFQAVCDWQLRRNGWHVDPACCSYALGVIPAIGSMIQYMTQPGDRILIQSPVYGDFFDIIHDNQREIVENRMIPNGDGTWSVDWADFEEKIRTVKMFLLCSPHNPLGIVWQRHELEKNGVSGQGKRRYSHLRRDPLRPDFQWQAPHPRRLPLPGGRRLCHYLHLCLQNL